MSEYRVTHSNVPAQCEYIDGEQLYSGLLVHIQPPVPSLNPDAVTRYLTNGSFEPIIDHSDLRDADTKDVVLLGSTPEQTTIYASIMSDAKDFLTLVTMDYTKRLLQFMGAKAFIGSLPTPDA
jgi:hypothetical protein